MDILESLAWWRVDWEKSLLVRIEGMGLVRAVDVGLGRVRRRTSLNICVGMKGSRS